MTSRHLFRLAVVAVCLGMCIIGQEPAVNWDSVMRAAKTYFSTPSSENAFGLYSVLPKTRIRGEEKDLSEGSVYVKTSKYIFDNLSVLEKQVMNADRNAVKVVVRLFAISDAGFTEWLCDILGGLVSVDAKMFLEEFSYLPETYQEMAEELGSVVHRGGVLDTQKPFSAEAALEELEKRVKAFESVESDDLLVIKLRGEAISLIKSDIQRIEAELGLIPMGTLGVFLQSSEISERRAAYLNIVRNGAQYVDQIKQGLETFARTKEKRIEVLKRYIYLAAMIRSDKFIPPLVAIFKDYGDLGGSCVYCCPIVFALTLYGAFSNWSPPEMMEGSSDYMVDDLRTGIREIVDMKRHPLVREPTRIEFADLEVQKWFDRIELLSVDELTKMAGAENPDPNEQYYGVQVLAHKVTDDKNLTEFYWLAIEEIGHDPSGFYRCSVYDAIERAEIARAQKNPLK